MPKAQISQDDYHQRDKDFDDTGFGADSPSGQPLRSGQRRVQQVASSRKAAIGDTK